MTTSHTIRKPRSHLFGVLVRIGEEIIAKAARRRCFRCEIPFRRVGGYSETSVGWMLLRLCVQCVMHLESGAPMRHPGRSA